MQLEVTRTIQAHAFPLTLLLPFNCIVVHLTFGITVGPVLSVLLLVGSACG